MHVSDGLHNMALCEIDLIETQEFNLQDRYDYLVNMAPPSAGFE